MASLKALAGKERLRAVDILKHLAEMDRRKAAEKAAFPNLFVYCVRELRYTHAETARRIQAARSAKSHGIIYRYLARGVLTITGVSLLAPHLTVENHRDLLRRAAGKSTREIEALVASLSPGPPSVERVRFIGAAPAPAAAPRAEDMFAPRPEAAPVEPPPAPAPPDVTPTSSTPSAPAALARVEITFYADARVWLDFQRLKELTRARWPSGRVEEVFGGAVEFMLERVDPERRKPARAAGETALAVAQAAAGAGAGAGAGNSRRIPSAVSAIVWRRDKGRCVYRADGGRKCGARGGLEIDHIVPWARGGRSDRPGNLRLLCRAHNQLEARRVFGDAKIDAAIRGP